MGDEIGIGVKGKNLVQQWNSAGRKLWLLTVGACAYRYGGDESVAYGVGEEGVDGWVELEGVARQFVE